MRVSLGLEYFGNRIDTIVAKRRTLWILSDYSRQLGGGTDPELLARADKDVSSAGAYSKGRKQRLMRCAKYFFVATVCLLLFVAIAKWVN